MGMVDSITNIGKLFKDIGSYRYDNENFTFQLGITFCRPDDYPVYDDVDDEYEDYEYEYFESDYCVDEGEVVVYPNEY